MKKRRFYLPLLLVVCMLFSMLPTFTPAVRAANAPAAPTNITVSPVGPGQLKLAWTPSEGATQVNVYKCSASGGNKAYLGTSYSSSYTVSNLENGVACSFSLVSVRKADGQTLVGAYSAPVTGTPEDGPSLPRNIVAAPAGTGQIKLSWDQNDTATQHNIYRLNPDTGAYGYIGTSYNSEYFAKNLVNGTSYSFKLIAVHKADGKTTLSAYSDPVTAKAVNGPEIPKNIAAAPAGSGTICITWSASALATQYNIYQYKEEKNTYAYIGTSYSTSYTVSNLTNGVSYSFKLVPVRKADGVTLVSAYSDPVTAIPENWPPVPKNIVAAPAGSGIIKLSWDPNEAATQHNIYKYDEAKGIYAYLGTSFSNSYLAKNLANGKEYSFKLVAVNKTDGNTQIGSFSDAVSAVAVNGPAIPATITVTPAGSGALRLSWSASEGATQYNIYKYNEEKQIYAYLGTSFETTYTVQGLTNGVQYSFKLVPVRKADGMTLVSAFSDAVVGTPNAGPTAPANLAAAATGDGIITLTWTASEGATQYNIYKLNDTNNYVYFATSYGESYAARSLAIGKEHFFKVVAVMKADGITAVGPYSEPVSAVALGTPVAPASLTAETLGISRVHLTWKASQGATQYNLYRRLTGGDNFIYFNTAYTNDFVVTNLSSSSSYDFKIVAVCKGNGLTFVGDYSNIATAQTLGKAAPPADFAGAATGAGEITLTWTPSERATSYYIYRYHGTQKAYIKIGESDGTSFTAGSFSNGVSYYFKIASVITEEPRTLVGDLSEVVIVKALGVPAVPKNLTAEAAGTNQIRLAWTAVTGATQYNIYKLNEAKQTYAYFGTSYSAAYTASGLSAGTEYTFKVLAATKGNGLTFVGDMSDPVSAKTLCTADGGHVPSEAVLENVTAATCSKTGSGESVVYCAVCGEEISREPVVLPTLPHTAGAEIRENEVPSTCTVAGSYVSVFNCTVCGAEISRETRTIALAAHTPLAAVEENRVDPTCAKQGTYQSVVYCAVCGGEISRTVKSIEKLPHTPAAEPVVENEVAATCSAFGSYDEVYYCTVCSGEASRETKQIAKLPHTPAAEPVIENRVPGTCKDPATYDEVYYCTVCQGEASRETIETEVDSTNHVGGTKRVNVIAATCISQGNTGALCCAGCDAIFELGVPTEIDYTNHVLVKDNENDEGHIATTVLRARAATCSQKGYSGDICCAYCEHVITPGSETPMTAHTPVADAGYAADCGHPGLTDGSHCSVCGATITPQTVIPATGAHHKTEKVRARSKGNCMKPGYKFDHYYCDVCGKYFRDANYTDEVTDLTTLIIPGNHSFVTKQETPDRLVPGTACGAYYQYYWTCQYCGDFSTTATPFNSNTKLEHNYQLGTWDPQYIANAPTCTNNAKYYKVCTNCGANSGLSETVENTALGHDYSVLVRQDSESTCAVQGQYTYRCSRCSINKKIDQPLAPNAHPEDKITSKMTGVISPTCTTYGEYYVSSVCNACGKILAQNEYHRVDPLPHSTYTVEYKAATCTADGNIKYYVCNNCGRLFSDAAATQQITLSDTVLPALGHKDNGNYVRVYSRQTTCTVDGLYNEVCYCANGCGTVMDTKPQQTEAKFNHMKNGVSTVVNVAASDATCIEPARTAGTRCTQCNTVMSGLTVVSPALGHDFTIPGNILNDNASGFYCSRCNAKNPNMLGTYNTLVNSMKLAGTQNYNYGHTVATFGQSTTVSNYNRFKSTGVVNILPDVKSQFDSEMKKSETTYSPLYPTGWIRTFLPIKNNQDVVSMLENGDATVTVEKLNGFNSNQILASIPDSFTATNGGTYDISRYRNISVSGEVIAVTVTVKKETYRPAGGISGVGANDMTALQKFCGKDIRGIADQYGENGVMEEREEDTGYSMVSRMALKSIVSNGTATYYFKAKNGDNGWSYEPIAAVYDTEIITSQDVSMSITLGISSGTITVDPYVTDHTKDFYLFSGFFPAT